MKNEAHKENVLFSGLQWFYWSAVAMFMGFIVKYFVDIGYTEIRIGFIMTGISVFLFSGQLALGYICDATRAIKLVIFVCFLSAIASMLILPAVSQRYLFVFFLCGVEAFAYHSLTPIIDSWTVRAKEKKQGINYGLTRALGSLGFAVTALIAGGLLDRYGMNLLFYLHGGFIAVAVIFLLPIDESMIKPSKSESLIGRLKLTDIRELLKGDYLLFTTLCIFIFASIRASQIYFPILLKNLGGTNKHLGLALLFQAAAEVPFLIITDRLLRRIGDTVLIFVSMIFFCLKIYLHLIVGTALAAVVIQSLQGPSYAVFLPASVHFINRISPPKSKTVAQAAAVAIYLGVGTILASSLGFVAIELAGIKAMYIFATLITAVVTVVYVVTLFRKGRVRTVGNQVQGEE
jgi:PPP family 3-phenylpropionic acid transporter